MKISDIESKIKYKFKNTKLLEQAFVHSSYANEQKAKQREVCDNERMEFLGDAVLDIIISQALYKAYPTADSGKLSKMYSNIVSADTLRQVVEKLDIICYLNVANGSKVKIDSNKVYSNLFEALLCAIYFDGGLTEANKFALHCLQPFIDDVCALSIDHITLLQERCQGCKPQKTWKYEIVNKTGTDDKPIYTCELYIDGKLVAVGSGNRKNTAKKNAAKIALDNWSEK